MRADEYAERTLEAAGWQLRVTSYRIDGVWHAKADNVSPGARIAQATGETRDAAERRAIERASERLAATRRTNT